jgi:arsenic resistance protein ArsH
MGDLNNTSAARTALYFDPDPAYRSLSLAIPEHEDDPDVRRTYRPFLSDPEVAERDWIAGLELSTALKIVEDNLHEKRNDRLKVLVLYGSLRQRSVFVKPVEGTLYYHCLITNIPRSYSRLLAYEASRILFRLGCDVRVFDPRELPVKDDVQFDHPKVQELRNLSKWSDGHVWVCPEQHGNLVRLLCAHCGFTLLIDDRRRSSRTKSIGYLSALVL